MKGIILAGGAGSRLYPLTKVITKQLQPIYDKPMIFYPLSMLMLCGIKEVLIITTPQDQEHFIRLLGDGDQFGIKIEYKVQDKPNGIAQAYLLAEDFLAGESSMMILGDNLFHGDFGCFRNAINRHSSGDGKTSACVFAYPVLDPERYGVVEFDKDTGVVLSIEEKPEKPRSNFAIPGLYILDGTAPERARVQKPSARGELEITDLIQTYLDEGKLGVEMINRGIAWLDTGTPQSLLEASSYIGAVEQRQGLKVACLEEISLRSGFIDLKGFEQRVKNLPNCDYKKYLESILIEFRG